VVVLLRPAEVPAWVRDRLAPLTGTRWVGVDGFGAAGKSTLAAAIAAALPGSVVVGVDDFGRAGLTGWAQAEFVRRVLEPLRAGRPGRYQTWDLDADAPTGWAEVPVGVPVVLEGVSATDAAVPVPWDVRLWVAVPAAVRRRRIERRDADRLDVWRDDWWPAEQAYARAQQPWRRADAIVRGGLA
jgi:hypothetical protein